METKITESMVMDYKKQPEPYQIQVINKSNTTKKFDIIQYVKGNSIDKDIEIIEQSSENKRMFLNNGCVTRLMRIQTSARGFLYDSFYVNGQGSFFFDKFSKDQFQNTILDVELNFTKTETSTLELDICADSTMWFTFFPSIICDESGKEVELKIDKPKTYGLKLKNTSADLKRVNLTDIMNGKDVEDIEVLQVHNSKVALNGKINLIRCFIANHANLYNSFWIDGKGHFLFDYFSANQFQTFVVEIDIKTNLDAQIEIEIPANETMCITLY